MVEGTSNPGDTSMQNQGLDRYQSDDSWAQDLPITESGIQKYEAFQRAFKGRKHQQIQPQQQNEKDLQKIAKYWADAFSNAKAIHDILQIQGWVSRMESIVQEAQNL